MQVPVSWPLTERSRRRILLETVGVYIAAGWVLLQAIDLVGPEIGLPDGSVRLALLLLLIGLIPVVLFGWTRARGAPSPALPARVDSAPTRRRLTVMPFRPLRADPDTDFLAYSLPDAIACSLSSLKSLTVRGSIAPNVDLDVVAAQAGVDLVLTGTLLSANGQLRVNTQLIELPDRTIIDSSSTQLALDDLFAIQDSIVRNVVRSLELKLEPEEQQRLERDLPTSASAYELYLRANQVAQQSNQWEPAIDLYLRCIQLDPTFAPAWARLGRGYRLLAKYAVPESAFGKTIQQSEDAFKRALELSPNLTLTHSLYAQLEVDLGKATEATVRLLRLLKEQGEDVDLYAGLVQSLRFCGLLEESVQAHLRARELDPGALTSVAHSYFMLGDYQSALAESRSTDIGYMPGLALAHLGLTNQAVAALTERAAVARGRVLPYVEGLLALLRGDRDRAYLKSLEALGREGHFSYDTLDAEARFYMARQLAYIGPPKEALVELQRVVTDGYVCLRMLDRDPWLESVRALTGFSALREQCSHLLIDARQRFDQAGGLESSTRAVQAA